MNPELISRVVSLIQKSGDKVVLADPASGKAVVVMDLDAYERLCVAAPAAPAAAPAVVASAAAAVEMPGTGAAAPKPVIMPAPPAPAPQEVEFKAEASAVSTKKKAIRVGPETMGATHVMADLTQEELIDKINRDIGAWKTAQERRRTEELKSVAQKMPQTETASTLEEEERFYLEPIE